MRGFRRLSLLLAILAVSFGSVAETKTVTLEVKNMVCSMCSVIYRAGWVCAIDDARCGGQASAQSRSDRVVAFSDVARFTKCVPSPDDHRAQPLPASHVAVHKQILGSPHRTTSGFKAGEDRAESRASALPASLQRSSLPGIGSTG